MKNLNWHDIIGWYGVLAILVAFALNSFGVFAADNAYYQLLNATGALGIVVSSFKKKDMQPVMLNVIWLLVALIALGRIVIGEV